MKLSMGVEGLRWALTCGFWIQRLWDLADLPGLAWMALLETLCRCWRMLRALLLPWKVNRHMKTMPEGRCADIDSFLENILIFQELSYIIGKVAWLETCVVSICSVTGWFGWVRCGLVRVFLNFWKTTKPRKPVMFQIRLLKWNVLFLLNNILPAVSHLPTGRFQLSCLYLSEGDHEINSGVFFIPSPVCLISALVLCKL